MLIITGENYLSSSTTSLGLGGLTLEVTKSEIVSGLCVGLLYLWLVAIAQIATGPAIPLLQRWTRSRQNEIDEAFNGGFPDDEDQRDSSEQYEAENQALTKVKSQDAAIRFGISSFSSIVFIAPSMILTIFVWIKYDGLVRVFSALTEIIC